MAEKEEGADVIAMLEALEEENKQLRSQKTAYDAQISNTSFQTQTDPNLAQYQTDTSDLLDMIEHFLKGDIQVTEDGNTFYTSPTKKVEKIVKKKKVFVDVIDDDMIPMNSYGVNSIMHILGNYLNRNTTLSFYDEERINEILADIGDQLAEFLYCNYEKMGMDTPFKKSKYKLIVLAVLHAIESAYRKALGGETMKEINRNTNIIQSENIGPSRMTSMPKKRWNPFKMNTW